MKRLAIVGVLVLAALLALFWQDVRLMLDPVGYWASRLATPEERPTALEELRTMGPKAGRAAPAVARVVEEDQNHSFAAGQVLATLGARAVPEIRRLMSSNTDARRCVVAALPELGPAGIELFDEVLMLLPDVPGGEDAEMVAIRAFETMGPAALDKLRALKDDPARGVRARTTLAKLCEKAAVSLLRALHDALPAVPARPTARLAHGDDDATIPLTISALRRSTAPGGTLLLPAEPAPDDDDATAALPRVLPIVPDSGSLSGPLQPTPLPPRAPARTGLTASQWTLIAVNVALLGVIIASLVWLAP